MSILNKEDHYHVYICPNCGGRRINFSRERSIDGNAIVRCDDCCWSHREPNRLGYSNNQLYCQGVAAYNRPTGSEHIVYPEEKTEREPLEDILSDFVKGNSTTDELLKDIVVELKEIKHVLSTTPPYFKAPNITCSGGEINLCSTCANYNSPIGQCERGVAGCKYEPDERERY